MTAVTDDGSQEIVTVTVPAPGLTLFARLLVTSL
jgi:hypothetical protein